MKAENVDKLVVGDYIRWLKPMGNSFDKDYVYGIITNIAMNNANDKEPEVRILDTRSRKNIWLPLRLLVDLGNLQVSNAAGWTKVINKP